MTGSARIVQISVSPGGVPVVAQITRYTAPCVNITASFRAGDPVQLLTEDEALALIGPR